MALVKSPKKHVNLFYSLDCEELANKVASHSQTNITLQNIKWRSASSLSLLWTTDTPQIRRVRCRVRLWHDTELQWITCFFQTITCGSVDVSVSFRISIRALYLRFTLWILCLVFHVSLRFCYSLLMDLCTSCWVLIINFVFIFIFGNWYLSLPLSCVTWNGRKLQCFVNSFIMKHKCGHWHVDTNNNLRIWHNTM